MCGDTVDQQLYSLGESEQARLQTNFSHVDVTHFAQANIHAKYIALTDPAILF